MSQDFVNSRSFELEQGTLFGKNNDYKIIEKLKNGGMGEVWLAKKEETLANGKKSTSKVVLKLLPKSQNNDQDEAIARERFAREYELVRNLQHQNICLARETGSDERSQRFYIITDYVDGMTLREWSEDQPDHENGISPKKLLPIFLQIADALDYLHKNGVVHRDVKPENIMMTGRSDAPRPLLIDFGISDRIRENIEIAGAVTAANLGIPGGTHPYMPPEQIDCRAQDGRTDQFALAMVLYEMLNGKFPRETFFAGNMLRNILFQKYSKHFTKQQKKAIKRALDPSPCNRFNSCTEFVNEAFDTVSLFSRIKQFVSSGSPVGVALWKNDINIIEVLKNPLQNKQHLIILGAVVLSFPVIWFLYGYAVKLWRMRTWNSREMAYASLNGKAEPRAIETEAERKAKAEAEAKAEAGRRLAAAFALSREKKAGDRKVWTADGIKYAFRWCPAGTFTMGSPSSEPGRYSNEGPQHKVTLTRGFWMLETEVTQGMWESVKGENPSYFKGDQNPVENVSWDECQDFCRKLSSKLSGKVSFPMEAQWEYACRAGTTGAYAGDLDAMAWYDKNSGSKTHPVRQKQPNKWNLYDMHGNVWEWCQDWYESYSPSPTSDPTGPDSGSARVYRGGCWGDYAENCRSASRAFIDPGLRYYDLGFRIVLAESDK